MMDQIKQKMAELVELICEARKYDRIKFGTNDALHRRNRIRTLNNVEKAIFMFNLSEDREKKI